MLQWMWKRIQDHESLKYSFDQPPILSGWQRRILWKMQSEYSWKTVYYPFGNGASWWWRFSGWKFFIYIVILHTINFLIERRRAKPSLKIRTSNAIFWHIYRPWPKKILGIIVFQDRKLQLSASVCNRISWNITKFQLIQLIQTIIFIFSISFLIKFKFCEDSRNPISNRCWKLQLSILKNKKVLFLKKIFLTHCQYQNKKALFTDSIFWKVLGNSSAGSIL